MSHLFQGNLHDTHFFCGEEQGTNFGFHFIFHYILHGFDIRAYIILLIFMEPGVALGFGWSPR